MRENIDFDAIDKFVGEFSGLLEWQSENPAVCFSFNLALESLIDHEIDRCVWTLKKSVEVSADGEGINHAIFQLLIQTGLYFEAIDVLGYLHEYGFKSPVSAANLVNCLVQVEDFSTAENVCLSELAQGMHVYTPLLVSRLAQIRDKQCRYFEAIALQRESLSLRKTLGVELDSHDHAYWNLSIYYESLGLIEEALKVAESGSVETPSIEEDWGNRILSLQKNDISEGMKSESEVENSLRGKIDFDGWFKAGLFWHADIPKDFFYETQDFLEDLWQNGATWSDESDLLFDDYWLGEDSLEESLARVESLSGHIHLQPSWPVYLETPDLSIAMTINRNYLLAWVGKGLEGLMVGVNVKTWDVYHAEDSDARFAVGAVLNWFLDCSLNFSSHEMFDRMPNKWSEIERPWEPKYLTTWSTTTIFHDDIENMRHHVDRRPPVAHRVRGHIRTLSERQPTDEARENAPAYIRRNMGPTDTFVRSYTKSGELGTDKLLNHLKTKSSLADFLGTAPLLESDWF